MFANSELIPNQEQTAPESQPSPLDTDEGRRYLLDLAAHLRRDRGEDRRLVRRLNRALVRGRVRSDPS